MNQAEDVEIVLGHKRRYKFHSGTLARNSTLFAELLTERNAAKLSSGARYEGSQIRWKIELTCMPSEQFPAGRLQLVELSPMGECADGRSDMMINENGRIPQAHKAMGQYEAIFYAFYNKEILIDDTDMSAALIDCHQLLQISDYLGCISLISKPIEVALIRHSQGLFRAIQVAPHAWIEMAYRIRSETIFKECMIHLVGNWRNIKGKPNLIDHFRRIPGLRALIERYHRSLLNQCKNLEHSVLSFYPGNMALPADDIPIKREHYAKDILVWMALSFYRQWVVQCIIMDRGRHSPDCGYQLYKQIGTAGESYMDKSVINQFHTKFPMTKKAMTVVENHLLEIKECMMGVVEHHKILKSNCQLDVHRFPVNYLTCIDFKRADLPWPAVNEAPREIPAEREYKPSGNDVARHYLETAKRFQSRSEDKEIEDEPEEYSDADDSADMEPAAKRARAN